MPEHAQSRPHYTVVGGGISGLALGWYLKKRFGNSINLTILEASERPGGWIKTSFQDGFLFEQGPRSCRPNGAGADTLSLIEDLNLQDQLLNAGSDAYRRYLYTEGCLRALPHNLLSLFTSQFTPTLLQAFWNDLRAHRGCEDESIADFAIRRLGKKATYLFFDPLVSGIYAGDIHSLSVAACFPKLWEWEQNHGSLLKGAFFGPKEKSNELSEWVSKTQRKGLFTLKGGMQVLTSTLAAQLKEHLRLSAKIEQIHFQSNKGIIELSDGQQIESDYLLMAVPPKSLSYLFSRHDNRIEGICDKIPSSSVGVVNLGYNAPVLQHKGFGHLIPSSENEEVLGITWDSSAFPHQNTFENQTRLTVMIKGSAFLSDRDGNRRHLEKIALQAVSRQLGIEQLPCSIAVHMATDAIPQYQVGHLDRLKMLEKCFSEIPVPVKLAGNGFYGVSVNDCIARAKTVVAE